MLLSHIGSLDAIRTSVNNLFFKFLSVKHILLLARTLTHTGNVGLYNCRLCVNTGWSSKASVLKSETHLLKWWKVSEQRLIVSVALFRHYSYNAFTPPFIQSFIHVYSISQRYLGEGAHCVPGSLPSSEIRSEIKLTKQLGEWSF